MTGVHPRLPQYLLLLWTLSHAAIALDNGLALTPPMGWMSWQRFKCNVDCEKYPKQCISEDLIKRTVRTMVSDGYLAAGYNYVAIDDCWMDKTRDRNGDLRPDPQRFPKGIKHLANFVHAHGMKLGIYGAVGPTTCMRYPGNANHIQRDARRYAEWGVDMFKLDGCFVPLNRLEPAYVGMAKSLNETSRPFAYLCSWPYYILLSGKFPPWDDIKRHCNMWRVADDVNESLDSILNIVDAYERLQDVIAPLAGPGSWNDADQLLIGNDGLNEEECQVQMAMWAILASPLFMSVDLDEIDPWAKEILMNERAIAINQDPLGRQGVKLADSPPHLGIWVKELVNKGLAIAFLRVQRKNMPEDAIFDDTVPLSIFKRYFPTESVTQEFRFDDVFGDALGLFTFQQSFHLERDNNQGAHVLFVTLTLIDRDDVGPPLVDGEEIRSQKQTDDRDSQAIVEYLRQKQEGRRSLLHERLFPVVFIVLAIVLVKLRYCIYRTLCKARLF